MSQAFPSPPVHIRRVEFKGQVWIGVTLPKRADYIALIRQIEGRVWKREFKLWLLPYSKEAYRQLNALFPGLIHTSPDLRLHHKRRPLGKYPPHL